MQARTPQPDPLYASRLVVLIPIYSSPGHTVVMDADDHERWVEEHGIRNVHLRVSGPHRYVVFRTREGNRELNLARVIMGSPFGRSVTTRDGDALNLRRRNLMMRAGSRGGQIKTIDKPEKKEQPFPPGTAGKQYHRWVRERLEACSVKPAIASPKAAAAPIRPRKLVVRETRKSISE